MKLYKILDKEKASVVRPLDSDLLESEVENLLEKDPVLLLGEEILYIGRQVKTDVGKKLDLIALDKYARLIVIELKRGYAPREIIAQVLDYTSWINKLSEREIEKIAKEYFEKQSLPFKSLHEAFEKTFGKALHKSVGEDISIILFAKDFSKEVIRPAEYLNENGVPISCIKFEIFSSTENEKYFLTEVVIGDELVNEETNKKEITAENKTFYKKLIDKLTKRLEEIYGDWTLSLGVERLFPFKTYQDRQGTWTCSYVDWLYKDEAKFCLEVAIYPGDEDEKQGFCLYLHARKQSTGLVNFFDSGASVLDVLEDFENESTSNKPQYAKYIEMDNFTYENIEKITITEIEKIKPLIETLLN